MNKENQDNTSNSLIVPTTTTSATIGLLPIQYIITAHFVSHKNYSRSSYNTALSTWYKLNALYLNNLHILIKTRYSTMELTLLSQQRNRSRTDLLQNTENIFK